MRLLDVNVLVYAHREDAPDHVDYREWLSEALMADEPAAGTGRSLGIRKRADARGNLITDAQLAATAIESGCELVSTDRDFARFEGLRWSRPLT